MNQTHVSNWESKASAYLGRDRPSEEGRTKSAPIDPSFAPVLTFAYCKPSHWCHNVTDSRQSEELQQLMQQMAALTRQSLSPGAAAADQYCRRVERGKNRDRAGGTRAARTVARRGSGVAHAK